MVLKTNDEIYVLISIGKYIITFHVFCNVPKMVLLSKILKVSSHLKNRFHLAKEQILQPVLNVPCCFLEKRTLFRPNKCTTIDFRLAGHKPNQSNCRKE